MNMNRRMLLSSIGVVAVSGALAACSSAQIANTEAAWNTFVDEVTAIVAKGCSIVQGYIPTVATIAAAVSALFGAGAEAFVSTIAGSVNAVATELCSAITANTPPAKLARLLASTEAAPIVVGTTTHGITAIGYSARFGTRRHSRR